MLHARMAARAERYVESGYDRPQVSCVDSWRRGKGRPGTERPLDRQVRVSIMAGTSSATAKPVPWSSYVRVNKLYLMQIGKDLLIT
jgi:hypothetical protein